MRSRLLISTAVLAMASVPAVALAQAPNPNQVYIRALTHGGTGCPAGTVGASVSPDAQAFTLFLDQFVAQAGPGVAPGESYKACNLSIDVRFPQGWSFSIFGVDYRGYAQLDRGVRGVQRSEYWIQGVGTRRVPLRSDLVGPYADDYIYSDRLPIEAVVWSPCGATRALNIRTSVAVVGAGQTRSGVMTVDSIDGEVKQIYGIRWRRCPAP